MKKETTLCFSGHRLLPLGDRLEKLKKLLKNELNTAIADGYTTFLFGGAYGFDLLAAEAVLSLQETYPVHLCAIVPYEGQCADWSVEQQSLYANILSQCNEVITLQSQCDAQCYKKRNQYMVDHSNRLICYWNRNPRSGTAQTMGMARRGNVQVVQLSP